MIAFVDELCKAAVALHGGEARRSLEKDLRSRLNGLVENGKAGGGGVT